MPHATRKRQGRQGSSRRAARPVPAGRPRSQRPDANAATTRSGNPIDWASLPPQGRLRGHRGGGPEHFGWCTSQLDGQRVDRCAKRIVIRKLTQFRGELVHSLKVRTLWPGSQPRAYTGGRDGRVLIFPFKTVLRIFRKSRMVCAILVS